MREIHANDAAPEVGGGWLDATDTRRGLLRRSGLLAGLGLTALLAGCSRGDDDDEDLPGDTEDSGLDEGAEDPGEAPGVDEESGIEEDTKGEVDTTEEPGDEASEENN